MFICCLLFICFVFEAQGGTIARAVEESGKMADPLMEKLISRTQSWEEAVNILEIWREVVAQFDGKRRYLTEDSPGYAVSRLSERERELLNDWQAWTPWVSKDINKEVYAVAVGAMLDYASRLSYVAEREDDSDSGSDVERPSFSNYGQKYLLALASSSLDSWEGHDKYLIDTWLHDPNTLVVGESREVPVKGLPGNPSFFPISEEDFLDCLDFRMTPLKIFWDDVFEPTDEQDWREVWDTVLYKWLAVCGQKNQSLENVLTSGLQRYIGVGEKGRRDPDELSVFSQKDIKGLMEYNLFTYAVQSLNRRFDIRPIQLSDFLGADRSMSLRFVFWFCMLHRFNAWMEKKKHTQTKPLDREKIWPVIQALLAQRLLAGKQLLLPAAEIFAFFNVNQEVRNVLFNRTSGMSFWEDSFLVQDRGFFALQDHGSREKSPSGLALTDDEIRGVLIEAALEEVMFACDDIFDKVSLTDEPKSGCLHMRNAFDAVKNDRDPIKNNAEARLQYALSMLYFAFSHGPSSVGDKHSLKCNLPQDTSRKEWASGARTAFLVDLKNQIARLCQSSYSKITTRADSALTKLIPEILQSFPVMDERKRSVRLAPMPVKKVEEWECGTVIKVNVEK